jgi:2-polyprenyl-3-methyl-5-hydroxy-6-metoxy-1,4-benzoquinol methylase
MSWEMKQSERFWDRSAKRFKGRVDPNDRVAIATLEYTRKYLHRNDIVLDFACASGRYALEIAPEVEEVWGIDISTEMIKVAKRNAVECDITNVQFIRGEITDRRLEDESYNVVLTFNIIQLLDNPVQVAARIKQLLKPGGIFISVTPCLGAGRSLLAAVIIMSSMLGIVPEAHRFKPNDVDALIHNTQFDLIETRILKDQLSAVFIAAMRRF